MANPQPLVGIALAAYKPDVDFFEQQLTSIVNQNYTNWFCVLSFDSPLEELQTNSRLAHFFSDRRFEFQVNPGNRGSIENFEAALQTCLLRSPKYIAFADQDDVWYPDKLGVLVEAIMPMPSLSVVHCDMNVLVRSQTSQFVELNETAWVAERRGVEHSSPSDFLVRNMAAGAGMLFDAELAHRFPKIPARQFAHDHWYALIASYLGKVVPLHKPLYAYRIHGLNVAGLSVYKGFFKASKASNSAGAIDHCRRVYNLSAARTNVAKSQGLPVTAAQRVMTVSKWDFGILYVLKAAASIRSDRALARACIARAVGKIISVFLSRPNDYSVW